MNQEQTADAIKVMQAWLDGDVIQARCNVGTEYDVDWHDITEGTWAFGRCEYRVKPKPREFWVWGAESVFGTGSGMVYWSDSRPLGEKHAIKVREVL